MIITTLRSISRMRKVAFMQSIILKYFVNREIFKIYVNKIII
jgi:hypothetical protein